MSDPRPDYDYAALDGAGQVAMTEHLLGQLGAALGRANELSLIDSRLEDLAQMGRALTDDDALRIVRLPRVDDLLGRQIGMQVSVVKYWLGQLDRLLAAVTPEAEAEREPGA